MLDPLNIEQNGNDEWTPKNMEQVLLLLIRIRNEPAMRKKIFKFSSSWLDFNPPVSDKVEEVLGDLVVDFAYYVDDPSKRWQDASYYGPEKLAKLIDEAFSKLEAVGISIPKN